MENNILLNGSLAYDYIMNFPDSFKNHILPDHIHMLNVSFVVNKMKKNLGGCAGNIAYTMHLLGGNPLVFAPLGKDGDEYLARFTELGIDTTYMPIYEHVLTSSAHITTDMDDNQITAFFPGAGEDATQMHIDDVKEKVKLTIIGPTKKDAMIQHARECVEQNIPYVFDPGQQVTALTDEEMKIAIEHATFLIGNDYELKLIEQKTGWDYDALRERVDVLIVTLGEKGSVIYTKDAEIEIPICTPLSVDDPTGAGDAYRAGFFTAYMQGKELEICGRVGAVAASYAIEKYGTQNHVFSREEFVERYSEAFGETISM